jgi:hypothetical protein
MTQNSKTETTTNRNKIMNARNGKIARLPLEIREELNQRLERSEPGPQLLAWLNALKEVKKLLKAEFDGAPISKQNLSEWRKGGFEEWLARQELWAKVQKVEFLAEELDEDRANVLADSVATVMAARYAALIADWDGEVDSRFEAKARVLNGLCRGVVQLQRGTHRAKKENDDFIRGLEEEHKQLKEMIKQRKLDQVWAITREPEVAKHFGGGELGRKLAKYIVALENDMPDVKLDMTGDEKPDPKLVPPTPKKRTPKRVRKTKAKRRAKPLKESEMDDAEVEESDAEESSPVQPGKASLEQSNAERNEERSGLGDGEERSGTNPENPPDSN